MSTPSSPSQPSATDRRSRAFVRWVISHYRLVLGGWLLLAVGLSIVAPPFADVAVRDNSAFLPADAPVVEGSLLVEEGWPDNAARADLVVVAARDDGPLTSGDDTYLSSLATALDPEAGRVDGIVALNSPVDPDNPIADSLRSPDGQSALLTMELRDAPYSDAADTTVAAIREVIDSTGTPEGLEVGTTGISAIGADQNAVINRTTGQTTILSVVLVSIILLLIFRSPVTPLVPLVTVGVALAVAQGVVSLLAAAGLQVSDLYESFATVIIFGAGTDYGLFMVSRYAEETNGYADRGNPPKGLVTTAAALVVVITGSAGTTIVGFASQSVAEFGLYRTMGPALAIAMAVALVAGLTLAPALIRLFGGLLYWPRRPKPRPVMGGSELRPIVGGSDHVLVPPPPGAPASPPPSVDEGSSKSPLAGGAVMIRIAGLVRSRPGRVAVVVGAGMLGLAALATLTSITRDDLAELPVDSPSVVGFALAERHFAPGELNPITIVIDDPDDPVDSAEALDALAVASTNLLRLDGVASVRSLALPTSGELPEDADSALADLQQLPAQVDQAAAGAAELSAGVADVGAGTGELASGLDQLAAELPAASSGAGQIAAGANEALAGARALLDGARQARDGARDLAAGAGELSAGLVAARDGSADLRDQVAAPAEASIAVAADSLDGFSIGRTDPRYVEAAEAVGETFALLTGRYPPQHPQAGDPVDPAYPGLTASLDGLATGLGDAVQGAGAVSDGATELAAGLDELVAGLESLIAGLEQLAAGAGDLSAGVNEAVAGASALADGAEELDAGVTGQLATGADQLATGLSDGAAALEGAPLDELLGGDGPFVLTAGMLADPVLREQLRVFIADDHHRTRLFVAPTTGPFEPESLALVDEAVEVVARSLQSSPLGDATIRPTGSTAFAVGIGEAADRDFPVIAMAVVIGLLLVMGGLLRSVVAPIYMVASVLLSYTAAIGVTTLIFQVIGGAEGLVWWVPSFLFVLLVALGVDYNIFLIGRAREEAEDGDTKDAIATALTATGATITSAGIILVGTFAVLALAPLQGLRQMGVAAATGILLDTFIVRTLLVPAVATLLGRLNWWPSARWRRP